MASHRNPRLTPWRSPSDLLSLRALFYPVNISSPEADTRALAISTVRALSTRSRLPHSLESTSDLTSAVLSDLPSTPSLTQRLTYSTAIIRFVNGLLDPAQQSHFALPMHQLARDLGLPASFVELRHAATHEELPSLCVLRAMAQRALQWLWIHYWATLDAGPESDDAVPVQDGEAWLLARAQNLVKRWRQLRKDNPLKELKAGDQSSEAKEARGIVKDVSEMWKGSEEGKEAVIMALLEEKALVPKGKKKARMMVGAVKLWMPLLRGVEKSVEGFLEGMVAAIVEGWRSEGEDARKKTDESKSKVDEEFNEALVVWVKELAVKGFMGDAERAVDIDSLAKECLVAPNKWSLELYEFLCKEDPEIKSRYNNLIDMAKLQAGSKTISKASPGRAGSKRSIEDIETEVVTYEENIRKLQEVPSAIGPNTRRKIHAAGKWKKWSGVWVDRPLGIAA